MITAGIRGKLSWERVFQVSISNFYKKDFNHNIQTIVLETSDNSEMDMSGFEENYTTEMIKTRSK